MKTRKYLMSMMLSTILLLTLGAAPYQQNGIRVPLPSGRDARKITIPADITPQDIAAIDPNSPTMKYYYEEFQTTRQDGGINYIKTEAYFISLLSVNYMGMDRFATDVFGTTGGLEPVDNVIASMPNFLAFMKHLSIGQTTRVAEPIGGFQKVTIKLTLNQAELKQHFPNIMSKFNGYLDNIWMELKDVDQNVLVRFNYANNDAQTVFIIDSKGYFVPMGLDGQPLPSAARTTPEDARQGVVLNLDAGFISKANLLNILKLMTFEVKKFSMRLTMKFSPDLLGISWSVVDVTPGNIQVTGMNTDILRNNLLHMKGTFAGTMDFKPMTSPTGEKMTFMRIYNSYEEIDNRLVRIALKTWGNMGSESMKDLSAPLAEAMMAVKRDVIIKTNSAR